MTQLTLDFGAPLPAPTGREKHARVWLWCAHLMSVEADAIRYSDAFAMDLNGERARRADELAMLDAAGDRFVAKADEVGGPDFHRRAWRDALIEFSGE